MRTAIGGRARVSGSASESFPPWRTLSTICGQTARQAPVDSIMSTRMRSVVVKRTPLASRRPRFRQNEGGAMVIHDRPHDAASAQARE